MVNGGDTMEKKKIVIIIVVIILILIVGCLLVFNNLSTNNKEVKVVSSLIDEQSKLEEDFPTELKDIDNADMAYLILMIFHH